MRDLRIVFMGTPDFAVGILKELMANGQNVVGVITAPDKPAGRGRKLKASAVKQYAQEQNLPLLQPEKLKDPEFLDALKQWDANLFVVVAFRMLPEVVWAMPEYGTFNLHASLLPEYRGAAPINWAVINGETKTGVTTFFIDAKIDTGAIIAQKQLPIQADETAGSLHDKLMLLGGQLTLETVKLIEADEAEPKPQPEAELKAAPKLHAANTRIDWNAPGQKIDWLIRGLSPYPAAWCELLNNGDTLKVKILGCRFEAASSGLESGQIRVDKKELWVAVNGGKLFITNMQLPGKKRMPVSELLNGYQFDLAAKFA